MRISRWIGWALLGFGAFLAINSLLGPLVFDSIKYHYAAAMRNQGIGLDVVALFAAAPIATAAGVLVLRGHPGGRVLAFAPATSAAYMMPQYVIGSDYLGLPGNNERFVPFHIFGFVAAVAIVLGAWAAIGGTVLEPDSERSDHRRGWVRRGSRWARKASYAVIGWFSLVPASVAAMAITMQINDDPLATVANTAVVRTAALVFVPVAVSLYRPLFTRPTEHNRIDADNRLPQRKREPIRAAVTRRGNAPSYTLREGPSPGFAERTNSCAQTRQRSGRTLSGGRGERTGSAASEPVAREPVQADTLLGGGECQFTVKGLGNANVELAREAPLGDRPRDRVTVRREVGDNVGDEIDQAP